MPLFTLHVPPRDDPRKTRGQDGIAISFPVGLFHPLLHAGLSRRTKTFHRPHLGRRQIHLQPEQSQARLSTGQLLVGDETEEEFNALLTALLHDHQPATITETLLVQDMAKYHWLADRALHLQKRAVAFENSIDPAELAILIRYHTANERAFHKALAALNASRKTRLAEIGSASKTVPAPPPMQKPTTPVTPPSTEKNPRNAGSRPQL